MLKKLRILLLALLTVLCCTVTAWADYDYIDLLRRDRRPQRR